MDSLKSKTEALISIQKLEVYNNVNVRKSHLFEDTNYSITNNSQLCMTTKKQKKYNKIQAISVHMELMLPKIN